MLVESSHRKEKGGRTRVRGGGLKRKNVKMKKEEKIPTSEVEESFLNTPPSRCLNEAAR